MFITKKQIKLASSLNASSLKKVLLGLVCLGLSTGHAVANTLDDLKFSALPGDRFEVRMEFTDTPPQPTGYTIEQPARIVLDFPGVNNGLEENRFPLSMSNAKSAMVLEGEGRTRLILNLAELASYSSRTEGDNTYIIQVGNTGVAVADNQATSTPPVSTAIVTDADAASEQQQRRASSGRAEITNIDFRRGDAGEGRVVVSLSSPQVNIDMQESGGAIELNFEGARVPADLANRYDVVDFATPVTYIDADNQASGAQVRVEASGEYDYLAYQSGGEYIISIKPLTEREIEERESRFNYTGDRISLNFQDIEVRAVLQIIAEFTGLNLVTSDSVSGNVALRLDNVPWDQALDLVLKTKGLDKRQVGNVLMVAPAAEIAERERQELETEKQLEELAPLRTEYIRVRYANARELFNLFGGNSSGGQGGGGAGGSGGNTTGTILSERGQAIVDERTNSIILTDTEEKIAQFRRLVDQIDIPIRQVMIEARIVIANTDFRKDLGVRWGGIGARMVNGNLVEVGGSTESLDGDPGSPAEFFNGGETDLEEDMVVDLGVGASNAATIAFDIITDNLLLDLELSALEDSGQAEIVSQPKVITGDKQQATIESGTEIPYQEASASGATSTSFKEAVLKLDVTPQITPDNNIIMDLIINQDSVGEIDLDSGIPTIDVTQIETQVLVKDGETVVLGGIYQTEQQNGVTKVPFFGDIPYLGRLFKQTVNRTNKRELLIFITPKIMAETLVQ
ncbi:type IV pilus secretin PilQ [Gilvimarinus sp. F26214L]|uniref:type IV pilus secretin PilQ n=1 Tax=Gilvimarinus sp. DZF01 TaxID=3461371 RepID=UPI0040461FDF